MKLSLFGMHFSAGRTAAARTPAAVPFSHRAVKEAPNLQVKAVSTPSSRRQVRMYGGAKVSRLTTDWPITITSANAEILVSAIALRSRLRELERDDDYFRQMLFLLENNVVGEHGIMLRMKSKKKSGKLASKLNRKVHKAWKDYFEPANCTVSRNLTGVEVQRLAVRALARDGAILFRKHRSFDNPFGYALEPIEIDRLDHYWSRPASGSANEIQFGVEMDRYYAPVAYHILVRHPGDVFAWRADAPGKHYYRERVPADEIIALWTIERAGQLIGMPFWPSVATRLHHLRNYEESEAIAARMAANKGGWFKKGGENAEYVGDDEDPNGNKLVNVEPGQWEELPTGWDPVPMDPNHPVEAFPSFVKAQLRGAASGANLPYNSVGNDLEGVNYSSIRAGLLESRDGFRYLQKLVHHKFVKLWFTDWLNYAILSGQIDIPITKVPQVINGTHWQGRRWPWVDPLKDVQADILAVQHGLDSRRNIIAEGGRDIEDVFEEQEEDEKLEQKHGLNFDQDPPEPPKPSNRPPGGAPGDDDAGPGRLFVNTRGRGRFAVNEG